MISIKYIICSFHLKSLIRSEYLFQETVLISSKQNGVLDFFVLHILAHLALTYSTSLIICCQYTFLPSTRQLSFFHLEQLCVVPSLCSNYLQFWVSPLGWIWVSAQVRWVSYNPRCQKHIVHADVSNKSSSCIWRWSDTCLFAVVSTHFCWNRFGHSASVFTLNLTGVFGWCRSVHTFLFKLASYLTRACHCNCS